MAKKKLDYEPTALFNTPQAFKGAVDTYFQDKKLFHTLSGLCRHLGFSSRHELSQYLNAHEGFKSAAEYAILRIEEVYEARASNLKNPNGPIFVLKALGWDEETKNIKANIINKGKADTKEAKQTIKVKIVR